MDFVVEMVDVTELRLHSKYPLRLKVAVQQAVLADAGLKCESPSTAGQSVEVLSFHQRKPKG